MWKLQPNTDDTTRRHTHSHLRLTQTEQTDRQTDSPDTASPSGPPTEDRPQVPAGEGGGAPHEVAEHAATSPRRRRGARSLLIERAWWTMDSPRRRRTRWPGRAHACDASRSRASPCATRRTPYRIGGALTLAREPRRRSRAATVASSAPVTSATSTYTWRPLESASAYCPLCGAT